MIDKSLQLALYASADRNPIHQDEEAAKVDGLPGVIAHRMLALGFLGQMLIRWVPQKQIRTLSARFAATSFPGDVLNCTGTVTGKRTESGENVQAGKATIALS